MKATAPLDCGPIRTPAGYLDHDHPLNLGRDRTGDCCAAWWAEYDRQNQGSVGRAEARVPRWTADHKHDGART